MAGGVGVFDEDVGAIEERKLRSASFEALVREPEVVLVFEAGADAGHEEDRVAVARVPELDEGVAARSAVEGELLLEGEEALSGTFWSVLAQLGRGTRSRGHGSASG